MKKLLLAVLSFIGMLQFTEAQSGFNFSCNRDTVLTCGQPCINLKALIPDVHGTTTNYGVNLISGPSGCFNPPVSPETPGNPTSIDRDDRYTDNINLSFDFPFYGILYNSLVVSANGMISFDLTNSLTFAHYGILNSGSFLTANAGNPPENLPSTLYDKACIMGPYHDIDIEYVSSPDRKLEYYELGTAPHRKWVAAFYKIPLYDSIAGCDVLYQNTHEIVIYEGLGLVEVHIFDKEICTSWNEGRAMVGMQNFDQDNGIMAPGRAASDDPWGAIGMNESWRFTPSDGPSLFKRVELYNSAGVLVSTGDTSSAANNNLAVNFPNVCIPAGVYVVKSTYKNINDPLTEVYGYDTINVIRTTTGPVINETVTPAPCGVNTTGTIVITAPNGASVVYSSNGGTAFQSSSTFNLPAGSYSIVARDTITGCVSNKTIVINTITTLTATADSTITNCPGSATGTITVTASLGTPGYTYSIDNGAYQSSNVFTGLLAGVHAVSVKDAANCVFSFNETVTDGTGYTTTASSSATTCPGANNGSITVSVPNAGTAPFKYELQGVAPQQNSPTFNNLAGGTMYTVIVQDANSCTYTFTVTVNNGPGFSTTATTTAAACATASNGTITVSAPGAPGVSPFQYAVDGLTAASNNVLTGLAVGPHNIVVTDAVGCSYTFTQNVAAGPGFTTNATSTNTSCLGVSTGSINVNVPAAATAPIQYDLNDPAPAQNSPTFSNLAAGTYAVTVTDANTCSYTFNQVVGSNPGVLATDSMVKSACAAVSTGKLFIRPTLGQAPYTYSKDSGVTFQVADSFINLAPGTYPIRVRDAVGCYYDFNATVTASTGVAANFVRLNSACLGVSSGKIIVQTTAGVAPFAYSINGGTTYQTSDTFPGLASGSYHIRVRDAVGCIYDSPSLTVGNDPGVLANATVLKAACTGSATGTIIVRPTAGVRPFQYSIDGGVTLNADSVFRNLIATAYNNIRVTDAQGCILNLPPQTVTNNPGVLTNSSTIQNASCATVPNGSITVNTTAGIAPFSFTMNTVPVVGPQTSNYFGGLFANTYSITIVDSAGCTKTISSVVGNNPKVKFDAINVVRPTCNGLSNGTITVNLSLGVTPYKYALDAGAFQSGNQFANVAAGVHTIHVSDANNCLIDSTFTVTQPVVLTAAAINSAVATCTGTPDGSITASGSGGTLPYQFTLDPTGVNGYQAANLFNTVRGNYKVTVKDALGCTAAASVFVDSVFNMFLDLGKDSTICVGQSVQIQPNTNLQTTVYAWSPKISLNDSTLRNPTATPNDTTKYRLTASFGICTLKDSITINVLHKPVPHAGNDTTICNLTTALLHGSATNTSGPVTYLWSPAQFLNRADSAIVVAKPDVSKTFLLTIQDAYGCGFTVTDEIRVDVQPPVPAFAGNDTNAVTGIPHQLHGLGAGPGGSYSWSWSPFNATISSPFAQNPTAVMQAHEYYFYLKATDFATCVGYDTVKITVYDGPTYYVPNAFSPNGDGINDRFHPTPVGIVKTDWFRVFNRYGELIFESQHWNDGWDGFYKGILQPLGTYVWMIQGKDRFGKTQSFKGTVVLVQ